jgi:rhamnosyltransferase
MKKIAGVVILYYPDKNEFLTNIKSYHSFVGKLIVIDNTPGLENYQNELGAFENLVYIKNEKNYGVASALNTAVRLAHASQYDWLLTMDQDSFFEPEQISNFINYFTEDFIDRNDVAIVCPEHELKPTKAEKINSFHPVITAITSGSIVNLDICRKLEGFEERLFIDEVDFEYCYRCNLAGYKIFQYDHVFLSHSIGRKISAGYFASIKRSQRIIHSPTRVYYMVRNHLYLASKYGKYFPEEFQKRRKALIVTLKNNLLFSGKFFQVCKAAWKGYKDFKQNKFEVMNTSGSILND